METAQPSRSVVARRTRRADKLASTRARDMPSLYIYMRCASSATNQTNFDLVPRAQSLV